MTITEARNAIIAANPNVSKNKIKKAFDWKLEQGNSIEESKALVEADIKLGVVGGNKPLDYSDPTGGEGVQHAQGEADSHFHHYGWRASKSKWGK